jgi:ABC-type antimicrobial peptide transport system permease subunit
MYLSLLQQPDPPSRMAISVRAAGGSPALLTESLAAALTGVNKDVAITFRMLSEQVNTSLVQERIVAMLSGFFGGLALLLAGLGLYGVTSYAVGRRRTEIGIRMALGAAPSGVVRTVLRRVAVLVGIGVALGAGISLWASRFVATLLYGLQPRDPATLVLAALVLSLIGAMAGWIPALRAARIDPARVLREGYVLTFMKYGGIRPAMHPRCLRCSSLKYSPLLPVLSVVAPWQRGASSPLRHRIHERQH